MKAFPFDRHIVESYARFSQSFSTIRAPDLRETIEREYKEGRFWPDALLSLNPRYEAGQPPTISSTPATFARKRPRFSRSGRSGFHFTGTRDRPSPKRGRDRVSL